MILKSLLALAGTAGSIFGTAQLPSLFKDSSAPEEKKVMEEPREEVLEVQEIKEIEEEEKTPPQEKAKTKEPIFYGRYTLKKYFGGGPGHRHAAFALKTDFFGQGEYIKAKDPAIWNYFQEAATNKATNEDILESACINLSNRDKIFYNGKDFIKEKIKAYCFTQIGFKL